MIFICTSIYQKNDSISYLNYLNKLVDQYTGRLVDYHSINKKCFNADYSASTEKIETNLN